MSCNLPFLTILLKMTSTIFDLAKNGNIAELKKYKGNVNVLDKWTRSPLDYAIANDHIDCMKYLVNELGADVNGIFDQVNPPLYHAVWYRDVEYTRFLVEKGAKCDDNFYIIHSAAVSGHVKNLACLVENGGANINICSESGSSWGLIHGAVTCGRLKCLAYLVENGVNINAVAYNHDRTARYTPVSLAISCGQIDCARYLVTKGACIDAPPGVKSPLCCSIEKGDVEIIEWVLSRGANPFNHDIILPDDDDDEIIRPIILAAREKFKQKKAILAMMSAKTHPRLGHNSTLQVLPTDLIRRLYSYVV
jgi:ankyrin repeat protein